MYLEKIKQNWKSGLTVSFVSIPLSISLALAAGATPLMGIITAVWAGLLASIFGGSNYNIVGPTGALSGILIVYAMKYGADSLSLLAILAGVMTLIVYFFRWHRYIVFIPSSVIHGFTVGVAFIIAAGQFNSAFGLSGLVAHEKLIENLYESLIHVNQMNLFAFVMFAIGLIFLLGWKKMGSKFPGVIVLAPIGMIFGYIAQKGIIHANFQTLFSKFGDISGSMLTIHKINFIWSQDIFIGAVAVCLVAILETLMSAKIADGMTKTKHRSRKEVLGVGLANIFSGIFGGIPATAALARTTLNVKSNANDKMSATISSVLIFIISAVLLSFFKYLPMPIVASILVFTAVQMVEAHHAIHIFIHDKTAFFVLAAVAVITVVEDPMVGIVVGSALALLIFANKMSVGETEITINKNMQIIKRINASQLVSTDEHGDVLVYRFAGQLTYVNTQSHLNNISKINGGTRVVILSFRNLFFIDMDGVAAVKEMVDILEGKGKKVVITSVNALISANLKHAGWYRKMHDNGSVFTSTQDGIQATQV